VSNPEFMGLETQVVEPGTLEAYNWRCMAREGARLGALGSWKEGGHGGVGGEDRGVGVWAGPWHYQWGLHWFCSCYRRRGRRREMNNPTYFE